MLMPILTQLYAVLTEAIRRKVAAPSHRQPPSPSNKEADTGDDVKKASGNSSAKKQEVHRSGVRWDQLV
ncbi:UNVERIFIED_CONTAM: hypothetical protein Sradi_1967900 [Sesamum radiatum]|uniref:Uncharacterized protein n=1 Tax=Sesamum radiatum TaxID=300843 RepID=A0AAW2THY8_SESRA